LPPSGLRSGSIGSGSDATSSTPCAAGNDLFLGAATNPPAQRAAHSPIAMKRERRGKPEIRIPRETIQAAKLCQIVLYSFIEPLQRNQSCAEELRDDDPAVIASVRTIWAGQVTDGSGLGGCSNNPAPWCASRLLSVPSLATPLPMPRFISVASEPVALCVLRQPSMRGRTR
jgi:hypothetical protein